MSPVLGARHITLRCKTTAIPADRPLAGTKSKRTASLVAAAKSTLSGKPVWASSVPSASGDRKKSADAAKIATVVIIGAILVVTRLWGLDSTPSEMTLAEEAFLQVARQIEFEGWIGLSHMHLSMGHLTGYAYVLSFWTNFIGDDIGMARLLSGVASLASIGISYLLVAHLFNRQVALFATFLMAVGVWPLTYARLALPTSVLLLVEVTALYLLLRAMHEETDDSTRTRLLVFSGALIGLGLYLDFAAIVFAVAAFCLWLRFYAAGSAQSCEFWVNDSRPSRFRPSSSACHSGRRPLRTHRCVTKSNYFWLPRLPAMPKAMA